MAQNPVLANFSKTYKPDTGTTYKHTATVRHKGTLIAFAMDSERRIRYTVLNLSDNPGDAANTAPPSVFDRDAWLGSPQELFFPSEITEVGFGVAGNARLPVFRKNKTAPEAASVVLPTPDRDTAAAFDQFRSTTARLSADAPFQVLSDGLYIYLFRRAMNDGRLDPSKTNSLQIVNATLLVDRFLLVDTKLMPKMEVRFQRSRSKTRPANRKDSLGAKDLDGNPFFEPTQELKFVGNLHAEGRFSALLLPTAVAGLQRWQIFAENSITGRMDCFNVERSAEGLFNTRGTPDAAAAQKGYAESALRFTAADAHVTLENGPRLGSAFTIEAWLKPTRSENATEPLALIGSEGTPAASRRQPTKAAPSIWVDQTKLLVGLGDGDKAWFEFSSKPILTPDEWNHIAVSFDGAVLRFYVNGRLREKTETANIYLDDVLQTAPDEAGKAQPKPEFFKNKPLKINADGTPNRVPLSRIGHTIHSFSGTLDEIRVWQRARKQDELSAEHGHRLTGLEPDLAAYWHFDERDGSRVLNMVGPEGEGTLHNLSGFERVASDAPIGEHTGLQRSSFIIPLRTFGSGPASLLYYQQSEAASGYDGKKKPLKQSGRVMFAASTTGLDGKKQMAALDFAVSATGRLAQIPDVVNLETLAVNSATNASLNANLDAISSLQAQYALLDEDVTRLAPLKEKLNAALAEQPSLSPNISADIADAALGSGLNEQLTALKNALVILQEGLNAILALDEALSTASVTVFMHNLSGESQTFGGVGVHQVTGTLRGQVSSLQFRGPIQVVLMDRAGLRTTPFSNDDEEFTISAHVDNDWNDRAVALEIMEKPVHTALRTSLAERRAAVDKIQATLTQSRDVVSAELTAKTTLRGTVKTDLDAKKNLLSSGASAVMPSVAIDQLGLGISGGLLGFAWSDAAPLLFDSATGSLAMYFQGTDNQFFVAYYDTRTERARYELQSESKVKALTCVARSADAGMDKIKIEVRSLKFEVPSVPPTSSAELQTSNFCDVEISGPGGLTETWLNVPRQPAEFAKVLNGLAEERSFIGSGALSPDGSQFQFDATGSGTRRSIPQGATIAVGDVRFVVQQAVGIGAKQISLKKTDPKKRSTVAKLPAFFIGYDYQANAATTNKLADLYNGSLLLTAVAEPSTVVQLIENQTKNTGTTLSCQWTANAPGTTLHFDGREQRAQSAHFADATNIKSFSPAGDVTLETWARPSRVSGTTRLLHHRSDSAAYTLGLEKQDLMSALTFNGSTDFIDLGRKPALALGSTFTQEVWIFPNADDDGFHGFLGGATDNLADGKQRAPSMYLTEKTKIHAGFGDGAGWNSFITPAILKPGAWNHVAATFDGTAYKVYVDGIERFSTNKHAGKTPLANTPVQFIGKMDNFFPGKIDDVRIWKRARTGAEILADMNRQLGGRETDLVGYWHFEGSKATDFSRNKNNGTLAGSPVVAASPLSAYKVFAGVQGQTLRSKQILPVGNWAHLALAYDQAYGMAFNGSDSSLDCGNDTTLDLSQDLSIEVFCSIKDLGRDQLILQKGDFANADTTQRVPYTLLLNSANRLVFAFENVDGKAVACITSSSLSAGFHKITATRGKQQSKDDSEKSKGILKSTEWYEMMLFVDGGAVNCQLYVDGDKKGSVGIVTKYETTQPTSDQGRKPVDIGNSKDKMVVGKALTAPSKAFKGDDSTNSEGLAINAFSGTITEIRIWNMDRSRILQTDGTTSAPDSRLIGQPLTGSEKGLVSWWRFQEGTGSRAFDSKSQNHALGFGTQWVNSPDPNGSKLRLFVNGERQQTETTAVPAASASPDQFTVGALRKAGGTFGEHFQGELEEMRVWKVTRTEEQIQDSLFRSLVERKNVGTESEQTFVEERENLLAYYTFDADPSNPSTLGDWSLLGNHLTLAEGATFIFSTAPVSGDVPLVRSALAGMKNTFNGLIDSAPAVQEYADMQTDASGNLVGVFKRCYGFVSKGQWTLITGYKVGDMAAEWIGQVQFAPELIGFIEGAPPVPGENLTTKSVDNIGDLDDYNQASFVEVLEAEETSYTYAANRDKGFDMSVEFLLAFAWDTELSAGIGAEAKVGSTEGHVGLKGAFEHSLGWLEDGSTSVGRAMGKSTSMELRGRFSSPEEVKSESFGRRFIPDNIGQALVKSETADVFALRLLRNGALISFQMKPNPDIPKDWNIISFPINPAYTKQGSLDGKIGLKPDVDYPNALTYSPDSSYFKPIEAYALKNKINRDETNLKNYYEQYAADTLGRRQAATHFTEGDLAVGSIVSKLPQLQKRNLVNTYVWTADGGLFAETLQTMDSKSETIGGSYTFTGMAGLSIEAVATVVVGAKGTLDALFGGHLNLSVNKTRESKSSFGLNVNLDKVERDIYLRRTNDAGQDELIFDTTDPKRPKPKKAPGKVDAYRFMSFYLEPNTDHYDLFFSKIVDPIWLEQSDDPAAVALRGARQPKTKPACWRVMHRVTYVSRVLPPLDLSAPASLEKTLQTLDVDSNYELIKLLEPYVADKIGNFPDFSAAVETTLARLLPELVPHKQEVKQFLSAYFGLVADEADSDTFGQSALRERVPNQPPIVNAGADQPFRHMEEPTELDATVIDDRIDRVEDIFVVWEKTSGPDESVTFEKPNAPQTKVTFTKRGRYDLRLTASDGLLSASDTLTVIVNERPVISAGAQQEVAAAKDANGNLLLHSDGKPVLETTLAGVITNNGLGDPDTGTLTVKWSKKSGFGTVKFQNEGQLDTQVTFPGRGHYLLQLSVNNGTFETTSEVLIAVAARASRDLQALYVFEEKTGATVRDVSGTGTALVLQIADPQSVLRGAGFLRIKTPTSLSTVGAATRLTDALQSANQLSLEVWLRPASADVQGFQRILTLSGGPTVRNFTLGQNRGTYQFHLRTDTTNLNASDKALAGGTAEAGKLTHLVVTRDTGGTLRMYVNGAEVASRKVAGSFSNWASDFKLTLGNEVGDGTSRAWLGDLHLAAVYARALIISEIQQNFQFGPDENLPPIVAAGSDTVVNWADFDWAASVQKKAVPLDGRVTQDRAEPGDVKWEQISGPTSGVSIVNKDVAQTSVEVVQKGRYAFRLTADDRSTVNADGELMADDRTLITSDEVTFTVNCPPNVEVKPAVQTQHLPLASTNGAVAETNLLALLKDSGLGDGSDSVTYRWTWPDKPSPNSTVVQFTDADKATAKARFTQRGLFNLKLEVSNGPLSTVVLLSITVNQMPALTVATLPVVTLPINSLTISGSVTANGLGNPADALHLEWSMGSGPDGGTVTFADKTKAQTIATFSKGGLYTLRLTATNPHNAELTASADVQATINTAPVVDLSPDPAPLLLPKPSGQPQNVVAIGLDATVSDDGLPETPGKVTLKWTSSPAVGVSIVPDDTDVAEARFAQKGKYTLQLTASDEAASTSKQMTVVVHAPPIVSAGQTVKATATDAMLVLPLTGTLPDNGLGDNPLPDPTTLLWGKVSGPADPVFATPTALRTQVTVPKMKGLYVLRLTADNGFAATESRMNLVVNEPAEIAVNVTIPSNQPRRRRLTVQVTSDGLGNPGQDVLSFIWAKTLGAAGVTFAPDATDPKVTVANFPSAGQYELEVTVGNGSGFVVTRKVTVAVAVS